MARVAGVFFLGGFGNRSCHQNIHRDCSPEQVILDEWELFSSDSSRRQSRKVWQKASWGFIAEATSVPSEYDQTLVCCDFEMESLFLLLLFLLLLDVTVIGYRLSDLS